jgi:hypothetical protein
MFSAALESKKLVRYDHTRWIDTHDTHQPARVVLLLALNYMLPLVERTGVDPLEV